MDIQMSGLKQKMEQELQEKITREQWEDCAAKFESEFKRTFPLTACLVKYAKKNMSTF